MLASHEGRDPLERLDARDHDELPLPPASLSPGGSNG
jgi:hypothetical protein